MRQSLHLSRMKIEMIILMVYHPMLMAEPMRGDQMLPAKIGFVASLASIRPEYIADRDHFCSGSLISENLVLTAAHCLDNMAYDKVDLVIGATDLRGAKPKYSVSSWITFDEWAANSDLMHTMSVELADVAIIRLRGQVTGITPANITTRQITELFGTNASLVGWATVANGTQRFLRKAEVKILTPTECDQRFELITNSSDPLPEGVMCSAANPFILMTKGDSGGPLLDHNNNILAINYGFCGGSIQNCTEEFADQHRFNSHTGFIDEFRQFIDEMKASYGAKICKSLVTLT